MADVECDECHEPATHYCDSGVDEGEFWRFCDAHADPDCCRPLAARTRRLEMAHVLVALEKAWSRCPDASLFDLLETFPTTGDAELLKALEKYAKGGG